MIFYEVIEAAARKAERVHTFINILSKKNVRRVSFLMRLSTGKISIL